MKYFNRRLHTKKRQIEVYYLVGRFLSGLLRMWSSMKMPLSIESDIWPCLPFWMQNTFYLRLPLLCGWMCTQTCWLPGDSCHDGGSRISAQTKIKKRIFLNFWLNYSDKVCLSQTEAISSFDMSELQYNSRQNGQK